MDEIAAPAGTEEMTLSLFGWPWTGLVTLLTLLVYFVLTYNVGRARMKYGVAPPETNGPPEFLRVFRVHVNTTEQMLMFLPLLWIAALAASDVVAAAIGVFWPIARIIYTAGYYKDVKKRMPGFILGLFVVGCLFILNAVQLIRSLLAWQS